MDLATTDDDSPVRPNIKSLYRTSRRSKAPNSSDKCPSDLPVELLSLEDNSPSSVQPDTATKRKPAKSLKTWRRDKSKHSVKNFKHKARMGGGKAGLQFVVFMANLIASCELLFSFISSHVLRLSVICSRAGWKYWDNYSYDGDYATALDRNDPNYDSEAEEYGGSAKMIVTKSASMTDLQQQSVLYSLNKCL